MHETFPSARFIGLNLRIVGIGQEHLLFRPATSDCDRKNISSYIDIGILTVLASTLALPTRSDADPPVAGHDTIARVPRYCCRDGVGPNAWQAAAYILMGNQFHCR